MPKRKARGSKAGKKRVSKQKKGKSDPAKRFLESVKSLADKSVLFVASPKGNLQEIVHSLRTSRNTKTRIQPGSTKTSYVPFVRFAIELRKPFKELLKPCAWESPYYDTSLPDPTQNIRVASYKKRTAKGIKLSVERVRTWPRTVLEKELKEIRKLLPKKVYVSRLDNRVFPKKSDALNHNKSILEKSRAREIKSAEKAFLSRTRVVQKQLRELEKKLRSKKAGSEKKIRESVSRKKKELALAKKAFVKSIQGIRKKHLQMARARIQEKAFSPKKRDFAVLAEVLFLPNTSCVVELETRKGTRQIPVKLRYDGAAIIGKCFSCGKELDNPSHTFVCVECGELLCHFDANKCRICKAPLCGRHQIVCLGCNRVACENCMRKCPTCGRKVCKDCPLKCENCGAIICPFCEIKTSRMLLDKKNKCKNCQE